MAQCSHHTYHLALAHDGHETIMGVCMVDTKPAYIHLALAHVMMITLHTLNKNRTDATSSALTP